MTTMTLAELQALPVFPAADKFPLLSDKEPDPERSGASKPGPLVRLAADLRENGVLQPLWTYQGQLLDGRNRLAAAALAELGELPVQEYFGADPLAFVVSLNVERRHLTPSQLAVLAVRLEPDYRAAAVEREKAGGAIDGEGEAIELAARALGVGVAQAKRAKTLSRLSPDLFAKVDAGAATVFAAYEHHTNTFVNDDGVRVPKSPGGRGTVTTEGVVGYNKETGGAIVGPVSVPRERTLLEQLESVLDKANDALSDIPPFLTSATEEEVATAARLSRRLGAISEKMSAVLGKAAR